MKWPPIIGSHVQLAIKIAKTSKTAVAGITYDNVIENFDFEKLTRSNEVTGDFDVGFGRGCFTARMIVRDDDGGGTRHDG